MGSAKATRGDMDMTKIPDDPTTKNALVALLRACRWKEFAPSHLAASHPHRDWLSPDNGYSVYVQRAP